MRIVVEFPAGIAPLRDRAPRLRRLSDSLRADPRVSDVKSLVDLTPGRILEYSLLYSEPDTVRARYPDFIDAYLSRDANATLVDVILADSTSLTTAMDVVRDLRWPRRR